MPDTHSDKVIAFGAPVELARFVQAVAQEEGLTISAVARRALLRDMRSSQQREDA